MFLSIIQVKPKRLKRLKICNFYLLELSGSTLGCKYLTELHLYLTVVKLIDDFTPEIGQMARSGQGGRDKALQRERRRGLEPTTST